MANTFYPVISDTHAYVNAAKYKEEGAFSYAQKGTGHMIYSSAWEPQRTNNFELIIENLDSLVTANYKETVEDSMKTTSNSNIYSLASDYSQDPDTNIIHPPNAGERIMLSVDSYTAPAIEIATITTNYGNNSIKWAGKPEFPNSTIVVNDYIGIQVERILSAWFRCAYDFKSEKIGLAKHYKKTGYLAEYDPKGGTARVWRLDGLWLASFNLGEWNQAGNEQRKLNATLVYDRVVPDYGVYDTYNPYGIWTGTKDETGKGWYKQDEPIRSTTSTNPNPPINTGETETNTD